MRKKVCLWQRLLCTLSVLMYVVVLRLWVGDRMMEVIFSQTGLRASEVLLGWERMRGQPILSALTAWEWGVDN